jgi:hypothetical protein
LRQDILGAGKGPEGVEEMGTERHTDKRGEP